MVITTQQYSYIIAAYSACYTLMQPVAGYVLDLLGTKVGYAVFAIVAHGDRTLFSREPFAARFQSGRDHRRFSRTDCASCQRQSAPAARHRRSGTENRPHNSTTR